MPPRMREKIVKDRIETLNSWIPGAAYERLLEFNYVHDLNLDEVQINELLYKLNQVFREKEEKNIAKITTKFQNQILNLMNRYGIKNIAAPYNVMEVEQIKKTAAKKIRQEQKKEKENQKRQERADEVANFTKNAASHFFWNHKKKLDEQISNLKEKLSIKAMNNNKLSSYNKVDITKEGFKTSYGSTTDSVDKMKGEIDNIKLNFDRLEKEYRNRVKDIDISIKNENGKDNGIKLLKSSVEWLIFSMKDVIKNSMNDLTQIKK